MNALHWTSMDTGGGCTALVHPLPSWHYALVTDLDGAGVPHCEPVLLGVYRDNGEVVSAARLPDLPEADRIVTAVNYLLSCDDEPRVLCWQIPTELEECFHAALDANVIGVDADDCYYIREQPCES